MPLTKAQLEWVEALESGEFQQGKGQLKTDDGRYCCLGVGAELGKRAGVIQEFDGTRGSLYLYPDVMKYLGLAEYRGRYGADNLLSKDNDSGKTVTEIAAIIRSEPDGLFQSPESGHPE